MNKNKFDAISTTIIESVGKVEDKGDIDVVMLKTISQWILTDLMQDEESMNDKLRELDRTKILTKKRG